MVDIFGLEITSQTVFYIMISLSFFVGLVLTISPEAFESLNRALQKEYGLKKRLMPKLEDTAFDPIDKIILRHRTTAGLIISIVSFILLLWYK